jgi:flagellar biosynthesis regulator FlaF
MLKGTKQALERSREQNLDAILIILKQREEDYRQTIENLAVERQQSLSHLEDLVQHQNTLLNKLRAYSRQLTNEIEKILARKNELVQDMTIENQELRMKLANAYQRLEQADTQLVQHGDTHVKLKQHMVELNNKVQAYEHIVRKSSKSSADC